MPNDITTPITLTGRHVALVPLTRSHCEPLQRAVADGELWKLPHTSIPAPEAMAAEIDRRLALQAAGSMLPFAVIALGPNSGSGSGSSPGLGLGSASGSAGPASASGSGTDLAEPVGMTTYMNIDAPNRRVEIGSTWYARRVQRTGLNTDSKLLLLTHAFDTLGCIAVELRTHFLNQASRRAIERLGARLDGILRAHQLAANGTLRDTCVYSITAADWPAVRTHLDWQLSQPR